jgi:hypothetical protein
MSFQTSSLVKALRRAGARVQVQEGRSARYEATLGNARMEWSDQEGFAIAVYLKCHWWQDDPQSDYFSGQWVNTIRHGIDRMRELSKREKGVMY